MAGSEDLAPVGGPDTTAANVGDEEARRRQFVLKVKQTVEMCVEHGMNKGQMFRVMREQGLHLGPAFAVYKELRHQNHDFFKEYCCMIDLKEQRQRLDRLVRAYRTGSARNTEGDAVPLPEETDAPGNNTELLPHHDGGGHQLLAPDLALSQQQLTQLLAGEPQVEVPNHGPRVASDVAPVGTAGPQQLPPWRQQQQNHAYEQALLADGAFQAGSACPQQAFHMPGWDEQQHNHHGQAFLADGVFQGSAWAQHQALNLPVAQQLYTNSIEETAASAGFRGLPFSQQPVELQGGQLPHNHQQAAAGGGFQGQTWPQHAGYLPEQAQQHYQPVANGFPSPLTSAAGLHSDAAMLDPWALSQGGIPRGHPSLWRPGI